MPPLDLARLLDCIAISDHLDGLLLYGASSATLEWVADGLTTRLEASGVANVDRVWLGSADTEDTLWGTSGLPEGWNRTGLLTPPDQTTRIVIVPDLSRLSLAAARAGVMVLGNRFVQIERRGESRMAAVRQRWIAALNDEQRDSVSRHLIDRFALRLRIAEQRDWERRAWLRRQIDSAPPRRRPRRSPVSRALPSVTVASNALDEVIAIAGRAPAEGLRSELSLLSLAQALARLSRTPTVSRATVRAAAQLVGRTPAGVDRTQDTLDEEPDSRASTRDSKARRATSTPASPIVTPMVDRGPQEIADTRPVEPGDIEATPESELDGVPVPLPPEGADPNTQPGPSGVLRLPWRQTQSAAAGRGMIIGTRRADSLRDLAIVDTLLAAAPFQPQRRKVLRGSKGLILRRTDLRSYRRAPAAGDLLVLVLDYSSVTTTNAWLTTLVPFLADAYAMRAEVCLVKVGARTAANELRADRVMARSVLVPSVAASLDEAAGKATPLADGLLLAFRTIRQTLGHGRATTRAATLIVVTDGRGNVSLDVSREGRWTSNVGRQGIEDAKRIARDLRDLPHVRRVLIDPGPTYLRDLPLGLGAALGAEVIPVERRDG